MVTARRSTRLCDYVARKKHCFVALAAVCKQELCNMHPFVSSQTAVQARSQGRFSRHAWMRKRRLCRFNIPQHPPHCGLCMLCADPMVSWCTQQPDVYYLPPVDTTPYAGKGRMRALCACTHSIQLCQPPVTTEVRGLSSITTCASSLPANQVFGNAHCKSCLIISVSERNTHYVFYTCSLIPCRHLCNISLQPS